MVRTMHIVIIIIIIIIITAMVSAILPRQQTDTGLTNMSLYRVLSFTTNCLMKTIMMTILMMVMRRRRMMMMMDKML